jgi:hypothetical protein
MAIWQADFFLIPSGAWLPDYRARLDHLAPRGRSWSAEIETWGAEDGNRLDVYLVNGAPSDGLLRLDLRNWDPAFTAGVLALLKAQRFTLEDGSGRLIEPVLGDVALAARGSPAFRFVEDPERFFRRLELGGLEDA